MQRDIGALPQELRRLTARGLPGLTAAQLGGPGLSVAFTINAGFGLRYPFSHETPQCSEGACLFRRMLRSNSAHYPAVAPFELS